MTGPFENVRTLDRANIAVVPLGTVNLVGGVAATFQQLQLSALLGHVSNLQSVFLDASIASAPVRCLNLKTRQYARWPAGSYGWQPLLIGADATQLQLDCADDATIGLCVSSFPYATQPADLGLLHGKLKSRRVDVPQNAANVVLLPANPLRAGYNITNTTAILYVLENDNAVASTTNFTKQMAAAEFFRGTDGYGGEVRGIWSAAGVGNALITEFF